MTLIVVAAVFSFTAMMTDMLLTAGSRYARLSHLLSGTTGLTAGPGPFERLIVAGVNNRHIARWAARCHQAVPARLAAIAITELAGSGEGEGVARIRLAVGQLLSGLAGAGVFATVAGMLWRDGRIILALTTAAGLCSYMWPIYNLTHRARLRIGQALDEMGSFVGLLAACTDAGLPLATAMELAAGRMRGVLGLELRTALARAGGIGGLCAGLSEMSGRLAHPAIRAVLTSLIYAEQLGTPLSGLLRRYGRMLSTMRRHAVCERIAAANVQLTVCTIFLLLPATIAAVVVPSLFGLLLQGW